jgi:hypothetical protein
VQACARRFKTVFSPLDKKKAAIKAAFFFKLQIAAD